MHALVLPERGAVEAVPLKVVDRLAIDRRASAAKVEHGVCHHGAQPAARERVADDAVHQRLHRTPEELRLSRVHHPVPPAARLHARQRAEVEGCGQAVRVERVVERAALVVELLTSYDGLRDAAEVVAQVVADLHTSGQSVTQSAQVGACRWTKALRTSKSTGKAADCPGSANAAEGNTMSRGRGRCGPGTASATMLRRRKVAPRGRFTNMRREKEREVRLWPPHK